MHGVSRSITMMMVVLRSLYQTGGLSNNNKNNNVLSLKNIYILQGRYKNNNRHLYAKQVTLKLHNKHKIKTFARILFLRS